MRKTRRRFSAAPARQNQIRSGETYVRVFENTPLGLAVLENHRVGAVVKHAQGDYAGVQVGDTILEVDQRRVDPFVEGHAVALTIQRAQVQRGRCRIRFFRPLTSLDRQLNKFHAPGTSDLAARQRTSVSAGAAASDTGSTSGRRRGRPRLSMVWRDEDDTLNKRRGSVDSVYAVDNLDQLVGDIEEFEYHADKDLLQCVDLLMKEVDGVLEDQRKRGRGDAQGLFKSNLLKPPPAPRHYTRRAGADQQTSANRNNKTSAMEKLWSRLANLCEMDPDEGELRPMFRYLNKWRELMFVMLEDVGRDRIAFARRPPKRPRDVAAAADCPWFFSVLSEENWEDVLFAHSTATEKLPLTATASKKTRDLLEPLIPALLLIAEPLLGDTASTAAASADSASTNTTPAGDDDNGPTAPHPVNRLGAQWISPACTLLGRIVRFDVNGIPCASEFDTGMLVELLRCNMPRVSSVVFQTLARRARICCARRPLGTIFGHDWEGSALCKTGAAGFGGAAGGAGDGEGHRARGKDAAQPPVTFFTLDGDMLREYPQLWHRYKGGGRTSGSATARGVQVAGVVCLRTWCLKGCILKSVDPSKPEEGFVLLSRVGADVGEDNNRGARGGSARGGAGVGARDAEGRVPLFSMKVPQRPQETEGWFIAIGKAIAASGNAAGEEGGLGSMLSMRTQSQPVGAAAMIVQERNGCGGSGSYNLASFNSMRIDSPRNGLVDGGSSSGGGSVAGRSGRSSSQSELPEPIECSIPESDESEEEKESEEDEEAAVAEKAAAAAEKAESQARGESKTATAAPPLQQQSVQEWRAELTSRAARILARNNSADGAGDTGLELMAPMFNMLAAGSRKLEQGQLSEAEFEMMLKKAEQFSAALEREVGPDEPKKKRTAAASSSSSSSSSSSTRQSSWKDRLLRSRSSPEPDSDDAFAPSAATTPTLTSRAQRSSLHRRQGSSPQLRAQALQKHLRRQQEEERQKGDGRRNWFGSRSSKHNKTGIIPNKTVNVYLPQSFDAHFFTDIVMLFGRKDDTVAAAAAAAATAATAVGTAAASGDVDADDAIRDLALHMNGHAADPHFGGSLLPSVTHKERKKYRKHPHLKEFGVLTDMLWFHTWFRSHTETLFESTGDAFAKLSASDVASLAHCARTIVYACVNVSATWFSTASAVAKANVKAVEEDGSGSSSLKSAAVRKDRRARLPALSAAVVAAARCLALLNVFREENDLFERENAAGTGASFVGRRAPLTSSTPQMPNPPEIFDTACCLLHVVRTVAGLERSFVGSDAGADVDVEVSAFHTFFVGDDLQTDLALLVETFDSIDSRWDVERHGNVCQRLFVLVASAGDGNGIRAAQGQTFAIDWLPRARVQRARRLRSNAAAAALSAAEAAGALDDVQSASAKGTASQNARCYGPEGQLMCGDGGWSLHCDGEGKVHWTHYELGMTVMEEPREAQAYRRVTEVEGWSVHPSPSGGAFWQREGAAGEKVWEEPECMRRQRHQYYDERLRPVEPPPVGGGGGGGGCGTVEGFVAELSDEEVKWWLAELARRRNKEE